MGTNAVQRAQPTGQPQRVKLLAGELQPGESVRAVLWCNEYLRTGRGRSIRGLAASLHEAQVKGNQALAAAGQTQGKAYTVNSIRQRLERWSVAFGWQARAEAYDAGIDEQRTRQAASIMGTGLATPHERVFTLKQLAEGLTGELQRRGFYGRRRKNLRTSDGSFITVSEEQFRADEIVQIRGLLDDLAKETGGRVQRSEVAFSGLAGALATAANFREDTEDAVIVSEGPASD